MEAYRTSAACYANDPGNKSAKNRDEEVVGELHAINYHDPESNFTVITTNLGKACGLVDDSYLSLGQSYRLFGRWDWNQRWGKQFKFDTIIRHVPMTEMGVVEYLKDHCNGIGHVKATKLWALFGQEVIRVLREEPGRVPGDILTPEQAELVSKQLASIADHETTKVALVSLFKGRGFGRKIYDKVLEKWGHKSPEVVRRNPFILQSYRLPGAGFRRCDKLWVELGKPKDALKRQLLALCASIENDRDGNTWFPAEQLVEMITSQMSDGRPRPKEALKLGLRARRLARIRDAVPEGSSSTGQLWLTLRKRAADEERIVRAMRRLQDEGIARRWPTSIPVSQSEGDGLPSTHQVAELLKATAGTVGCFTGGPGSGKTHTLSFLLREILRNYRGCSIAVAAPTGKAAVRATESLSARKIPIRATTIHQMLGISRNGHDGDGWGFEHNAKNPLDAHFVIVDESSMIDVPLMADLLIALKPGTHVLFVGDTHQLPPVGHGAPFRDLIDAGVPSGQLTEIRRNAGTIVRCCAAVKDGVRFQLPTKLDLEVEDPVNVRIIDSRDGDEAVDKLLQILEGMKRWDRVWDVQIITAKNDKGAVSRKALNQKLKPILNRNAVQVARNPFSIGDKIICTRNTIVEGVEADPFKSRKGEYPVEVRGYLNIDEDVYVANGEIGRVYAVDEQYAIVRFGTSGDRRPLVKLRVKPIKENVDDEAESDASDASDFDLGYAITVHKAQGSESPLVIVMADEGSHMICGREWWYTAISRASQACLVIGSQAVFEKQVKSQRLSKRKTFLKELVSGEISLPELLVNEVDADQTGSE